MQKSKKNITHIKERSAMQKKIVLTKILTI